MRGASWIAWQPQPPTSHTHDVTMPGARPDGWPIDGGAGQVDAGAASGLVAAPCIVLMILIHRDLSVAVRRHRFAARAKGRVAAAVAHDPADLLALDIAVDARHPRVDVGEQQALAVRDDVIGPASGARRGRLD